MKRSFFLLLLISALPLISNAQIKDIDGNMDDEISSQTGFILYDTKQFNMGWGDDWCRMGNVAPFNRLEEKYKKLEMEGGNGNEWFGVGLKKKLNLALDPITFYMEYYQGARTPGSEINFWFVNKLESDKNPAERSDYIRFRLYNAKEPGNKTPVVLSIESNTGGNVKICKTFEGLELDKKYRMKITLSTKNFHVKINKKNIASGSHSFKWTTGYFIITNANSRKGDVDRIDSVQIRQ